MAKELKWNPTDNTLNRHDDTIYKAIGVDGSTRLIKYTDRGYVELNINDGSELGPIGKEEALRLMPRDQRGNPKPLTFEEKTSYVEKFDASGNEYVDPKQTYLEEQQDVIATNQRLNAATDRAHERETGIRESARYGREAELDPKYAGESISMAEFDRNKKWEAGRRPIANNAPAYYPSDPNEIRNFEQTNYSLNPSSAVETGGTNEWTDKGFGAPGTVDPGYYQKGSVDFQQFTGGQTEFPSLDAAMAPGLDQKNLQVGTGGDRGLFEVDDDFYRSKDGTLMKDSGWFGGDDKAATQADIDAGIIDQNSSSPWGSTEGWNTAGTVMKGVGGLASAYTGIKNYQLARDAHNTQKNQWQANYDQRLRAYQDNKDLANQDIDAKNRVLRARNKNRTDLYEHI